MGSKSVEMANKVPLITGYFWVIKVLSTTVGETFADWINNSLGLGLTKTSFLIFMVLIGFLILQFRDLEYRAIHYWEVVVFMSIAGTLFTDNLTDNLKVSLTLSTLFFGLLLAVTFFIWNYEEKTLSIKEINTRRREVFYWIVILLTFALGTASGDLIAEKIDLGYGKTFLLFVGIVTAILALWRMKLINNILTFWLCYIMTRPLGAASGDFLSQAKSDGGIGLGTEITSITYLILIIGFVTYLHLRKVDVIK